jgi:hypothetical protein
MASKPWPILKEEYQKQYDSIAEYINKSLANNIDTLRDALSQYVQHAGVATDPANDQIYNTILSTSKQINDNKTALLNLNSNLGQAIKDYTKTVDMDGALQENGKLQTAIKALEKELAEASEDEQSALVRDEVLRTRDTNITRHQLFLLGRPLRPSFIPFLWALSILFIGVSVLLITQFFPIPVEQWPYVMAYIGSIFSEPWIWMSLFGSVCIVMFFLILKLMGFFK